MNGSGNESKSEVSDKSPDGRGGVRLVKEPKENHVDRSLSRWGFISTREAKIMENDLWMGQVEFGWYVRQKKIIKTDLGMGLGPKEAETKSTKNHDSLHCSKDKMFTTSVLI